MACTLLACCLSKIAEDAIIERTLLYEPLAKNRRNPIPSGGDLD
ncbi:hypothetical protein SAMN06265222_11027 [Neorhodopirellula lusitana]|uniref:Uncharacterized protein n=1 Tax=Neorhodopirellula lusitana TaxID=445327 RepID=A0ABY1QBJ3_9BACT|nr:hypothetical protein SAMN06265222_11027 [Neorhodopirellula lusitana]